MIKIGAKNLLELGTVTTSTTAAGYGKERLYDRKRSERMKADAAGQFDVDLELSVAGAASALVFVNHNIGADVELYADDVTIGTSLVDTFSPAGVDPFVVVFASATKLKWRIRFLAFGSALEVGEAMLTELYEFSNPILAESGIRTIGNTRRRVSPGGYRKAVKRGASRVQVPMGYATLLTAELDIIRAAFAACRDATQNVIVQDLFDTWRWMSWIDDRVEFTPIAPGQHRGELLFEEAL